MAGKSTPNTRAKAAREKGKKQYSLTHPCVWCGEHLNTADKTLKHTSKVCADKQKANVAKAEKKSSKSSSK